MRTSRPTTFRSLIQNTPPSLFAANNFARSAMARSTTLFSRPMLLKSGIDGGVSLLAGLSALCMGGTFILYYFGVTGGEESICNLVVSSWTEIERKRAVTVSCWQRQFRLCFERDSELQLFWMIFEDMFHGFAVFIHSIEILVWMQTAMVDRRTLGSWIRRRCWTLYSRDTSVWRGMISFDQRKAWQYQLDLRIGSVTLKAFEIVCVHPCWPSSALGHHCSESLSH